MPPSWPVAVHRLFENIEIDWQRLSEPNQDEREVRPAQEGGPGTRLSLANFRDEHLRSLAALRRLYGLAAERGLIRDSEASFFRFLATVASCLRAGERPAALLKYLLERREFPATLEDEDRAMEPVRRERAAGLRILRRKDAQVVPEAPGKMRLPVKITPRLSPGDVRRP